MFNKKRYYFQSVFLFSLFLLKSSLFSQIFISNADTSSTYIFKSADISTQSSPLTKSFIFSDAFFSKKLSSVSINTQLIPIEKIFIHKEDAFLSTDNITSIGEINNIKLNETYSLFQNYPNPFNPTTTIQYQLPIAEYVEISIYNTLGQRIRTLLKKWQLAGRYQVIWNGKDDKGRPVASGVYVYQIKAGDFVKARKMVLMR